MSQHNAIDPLIGHMKNDSSLNKNYLKGTDGDQINAVMNNVDYNFRVILNKLHLFSLD